MFNLHVPKAFEKLFWAKSIQFKQHFKRENRQKKILGLFKRQSNTDSIDKDQHIKEPREIPLKKMTSEFKKLNKEGAVKTSSRHFNEAKRKVVVLPMSTDPKNIRPGFLSFFIHILFIQKVFIWFPVGFSVAAKIWPKTKYMFLALNTCVATFLFYYQHQI